MQLFDLTGKTALITGASSGLGERFAHCLTDAGAHVILTARRFDKLQALAHMLGSAEALEMDVTNKESVQKLFSYLEENGKKILIFALTMLGLQKQLLFLSIMRIITSKI